MVQGIKFQQDVDRDVRKKNVRPGEYMVLKFDFSQVGRYLDLDEAARGLKNYIIDTIKEFYKNYSCYLGKPADQLISENIDREGPASCLSSLAHLVDYSTKVAERSGGAYLLANVKGVSN